MFHLFVKPSVGNSGKHVHEFVW